MINLRNFDLNLLRIFEAVFKDGSVSKAADKLGLSQPAVSNALNRIRRQFEDPLFVRTNKGLEPTLKAQQLAEAVSQGLTTIRAGLTATANFDPAVSQRRFTLLMTDVGEIAFLPKVLPTIQKRAPGIVLTVNEFGMERYGELLESGAADLAIGRLRLPDNLCRAAIHTSPYVVVMSRANKSVTVDAAGVASISFEDYINAPHIFVMPRGASGDPVTEALGERTSRRRVVLSIPHAVALPMIIGDSDMIATIPKVCADQLVAGGALMQVPAPFFIEQSLVYQWWHRRNLNDPGHRWLRDIFADAGV
jgi:DNA-binding transcriptional LysR family regulator